MEWGHASSGTVGVERSRARRSMEGALLVSPPEKASGTRRRPHAAAESAPRREAEGSPQRLHKRTGPRDPCLGVVSEDVDAARRGHGARPGCPLDLLRQAHLDVERVLGQPPGLRQRLLDDSEAGVVLAPHVQDVHKPVPPLVRTGPAARRGHACARCVAKRFI